MRRVVRLVAVGLALLATTSGSASAAGVAIAPAAGAQDQTYTITGSGLQPGLALDINFVSPEGTLFSTAALDQVVVVDADGNFEFSFVPQAEFTGASAGTWTAQVCTSGVDDCVQTTFEISL